MPPVYADKDDIERVVLNILSNSIKYTPENGEIKIYVGFVYNDAYIKIFDNWIGIPEKDLSRIFERFYRVDKARTREMGGTGLGLSIAKEILDKNGGSIDIKSVVGQGTEVVITIPTKSWFRNWRQDDFVDFEVVDKNHLFDAFDYNSEIASKALNSTKVKKCKTPPLKVEKISNI